MHWFFLAAGVAVVAMGWALFVAPVYRAWRSLDERMADQVTQSAELLRRCTSFSSGFGRVSTIR